LIVDPKSPVQLRDAIYRLLHDPDLAERLGRAGRIQARKFTASAVQRQIEEVYLRALTHRPD
jgi:glycosyltransferase involved in cell wall biosynthesis